MKAVEFSGVTFRYDKTQTKKILNNLCFSVEKGSFTCILGSNGSGKSTAARLINGLLIPDEGVVTVLGRDTRDKNSLFEVRKSAGMVFQNPDNQMIATMVEDDIAFGPENIGIPPKEIGERIDFALKATGMENFRNVAGQRLSGGQKQRIAIAGVLAIKPDILILDESTAMLDPKGRKEVMDVVKKLNKENGMTVICITHYMEEAVLADDVIILNEGEVVMQGNPEKIFSKADVLPCYGIDVPRAVYIANELRKNNFPIKDNILTAEDLSEALCALFAKI